MRKESLDALPDRTRALCHWLKRSFKTSEEWADKATHIYLDANGDDALSRTILATEIRRHFIADSPGSEEIDRWNEGHTETERVLVVAPKITEANAAYVDWLYVADYLLLCCGTPRDEFDEVNTGRRGMHGKLAQSHRLRSLVAEAIKLLEADDGIDDERAVEQLKKIDKDASFATLKEARRWLKAKARPLPSAEPAEPPMIGLYKSIY